MESKACSKCKIELALIEFTFNPKGKYGRYSICKSCSNKNPTRKRTRREWDKNNYENHRKYLNKQRAERRKKRMRTDKLYALKVRVRDAVRDAIRRRKFEKRSRTRDILGCSFTDLLNHLKQTWQKNYPDRPLIWEEVHIDHIKPVRLAETEEDVIKLNHFTNLQLLTREDNIKKGGTYTEQEREEINAPN